MFGLQVFSSDWTKVKVLIIQPLYYVFFIFLIYLFTDSRTCGGSPPTEGPDKEGPGHRKDSRFT